MTRLRAWLVHVWPFLAGAVAVAVLGAMTFSVVVALDERNRSREVLDEVRDVAQDAKAASDAARMASEGNRQLLERNDPCLPGDPPESQRCIRQRQSDKVVADAIARISAEVIAGIDAQHAEVRALLGRVLATLERLATQRPVAGPPGPQGGTKGDGTDRQRRVGSHAADRATTAGTA